MTVTHIEYPLFLQLVNLFKFVKSLILAANTSFKSAELAHKLLARSFGTLKCLDTNLIAVAAAVEF